MAEFKCKEDPTKNGATKNSRDSWQLLILVLPKLYPTKDLEAFVELITMNQKPTTMEKDDHTIEDKSEPN
jgi:hypothetical protein